ncbi:carboxypeptidase-like regulatory domain-containing protein [Runella aurantiaca]|uniref:Carboxypeptidase-like regulatory domain-containing protein n=1 Tax=Runella aurantiaca TaxID=2282308 RepID=A0A369I5X2_9BACT|nr:carboxypeptidase-like regulatory domain-containing protein [Runella aurantiaca]RDB04300.1 hypothetical protein DVG78_19060 [Runella aurantiaca]
MNPSLNTLVILLMTLPGIILGQSLEIKGIVRDKNKVGIPCATISLKNKAQGYITDEKGYYQLNVSPNDTLMVSSPGFEPSLISIKNVVVLSPLFIYLVPKEPLQLIPIENTNLFQRSSMEGVFDQPSRATFNAALGQSVALKIENSAKKEALLSKIHAKFDKKTLAQTKLRIRVFSISPVTGEPLNDLLTKSIIVPITSETFLFDIEPYHIAIPAEGCFVGFDWIEMPKGIKKQPQSASSYTQIDFLKPCLKTTSKICSTKTFSRVFASEWRSWNPQSSEHCPSNVFIAATLKY